MHIYSIANRPTTTTPRMSESYCNDDSLFHSKIFHNNDLVSEIISFLDPQSLLSISSVSKSLQNCLGYHHVLGCTATNNKTRTVCDRKKKNNNAVLILNKLVSVYGIGKSDCPNHSSRKTIHNLTQTNFKTPLLPLPSPIRLLRLINGRRCEKCGKDIPSPCVWAGPTGRTVVVLPSLSFGQFCCTPCLFVG